MALALDSHGNPMTGDTATIDLYDRAIDRLVRFHPDVVGLTGELTAEQAPSPMALVLAAYLNLMSTDPDDLGPVRSAHDTLSDMQMNEREQAHRAAVGAWLEGDWSGAALRLDDLLIAVASRSAGVDARPSTRLLPR